MFLVPLFIKSIKMEDTSKNVIVTLLKEHFHNAEAQRRYLEHQLNQAPEFRVTELEENELEEALLQAGNIAQEYYKALIDLEGYNLQKPSWMP